jgi:hypothetical protein
LGDSGSTSRGGASGFRGGGSGSVVAGAFAEDGWRFAAGGEGSGEIFSGEGFICGSWTVFDAVRWYKRSVLAHPIIPETTKESANMTFIAGMTGTRNWQTIQKRRWWRKRLRAKIFAAITVEKLRRE